jgi:hypothetical protein
MTSWTIQKKTMAIPGPASSDVEGADDRRDQSFPIGDARWAMKPQMASAAMRVSLDHEIDNVYLATTLWGDSPEPLVAVDTPVTPDLLPSLREAGFRSIVVSARPGNLEFVDSDLRGNLWRALDSVYRCYEERVPGAAAAFEDLARCARALRASATRSGSIPPPPPGPAYGRGARMNDALNGAAVAVFLAQRLELPRQAQLDLTEGMLLRDLAQPLTLPDAPRLQPSERCKLEPHAEAGYDWLHRGEWSRARARLVVLQHHERPDGSGYPGRLKGLHRVERMAGERFNRDLMNRLAEIAGVADAAVALNADRPYRRAWTWPRISRELSGDGTKRFSQGVVQELLTHWGSASGASQLTA